MGTIETATIGYAHPTLFEQAMLKLTKGYTKNNLFSALSFVAMIIYIILYIRDHPVDTRKFFDLSKLMKLIGLKGTGH